MNNLTSGLRRKLGIMKWLIPLGLVLVVIAYEVGPSRWIFNGFGFTNHLIVEILLFGTVGPMLAFLVLELLGRWIEERELAEYQAALLDKAQKKEIKVNQISDDTIQVLFAASLLFNTFKSDQPDSQQITTDQIEIMEQALHEAIQRLRSQLLS